MCGRIVTLLICHLVSTANSAIASSNSPTKSFTYTSKQTNISVVQSPSRSASAHWTSSQGNTDASFSERSHFRWSQAYSARNVATSQSDCSISKGH